MVGITAYGGYLPKMRLSRKAMAEANSWFSPGLRGLGKGHRTVAGWDEDPITMGVEAARDCLQGDDRAAVDSVYFASTTMPFADRLNAALISGALGLQEDASALDVSSSQRAGTSALLAALSAAKAEDSKKALVIASDNRKALAASVQEMRIGDGAAAVAVGSDDVIARYLGGHSFTVDFVDHFRGAGEEHDYYWEERWIRDEGYGKIVPKVVAKALENANVSPEDIDHFILPCVLRGVPQKIAKACGIKPEAVRDILNDGCGDTGVAHPIVMLVHTLQNVALGDKILLTSFGQGSDALIFEVTDALLALSARNGIVGALANGREEANYLKMLAFRKQLKLDVGMRAERDNKVALTTLYRRRDMLEGLVGGKCTKCGTAQFPRTPICVEESCKAVDAQEPYSFAELTGEVLSWSADHLAFSMDPPQHYGVITFKEGGRFIADITDVDQGTLEPGVKVRMVFRIKDFDDRRGFRRYFWKALPLVEQQ
ncbi:MAG: OB-fold domain-containing protein [Kordiimonadaceae bacterium]|nr:OB-fold domain-containing protein [Kordiimonadaceae bacterium]